MISDDKKQLPHVLSCIADEASQRELQTIDEEEDFLDESKDNFTINSPKTHFKIYYFPASGISRMFSCPMVLRLIACMLFLEITSYLRETYRSLPKTRQSNPYTTLPVTSNAWERERQSHSREGRRWSMALSSMGHSQASAQSLQSISGEKDQGIFHLIYFKFINVFFIHYRFYVLGIKCTFYSSKNLIKYDNYY